VSRLSAARMVELAGELSVRDRAITETVARLRLVSLKQLESLHFAEVQRPSSRARLARRTCARLVERGVLGRLERRIGGVRAGAAGYIYFAAPAGQRLVAYWQGEGLRRPRARYEPTRTFVRHAIGVSECYAQLVAADREGVELLAFESEPTRTFIGPGGTRSVLRPDAFVRLGLGVDGATELHAFLEIDCGTEGRQALARKCRAYVAAWRSGLAPVFPQVVWITTTERRAELLREVCAWMPAEAWKLFVVTTPERALEILTGSLPARGEAS
jgi:Replication-relaxation